jgi:CheY-like chemotaxis protein
MEAVNGLECLQKAPEFKPDIILLDLVMPVMDGFEATRQLRQTPAFQDTIIFAVSASVFGYDQDASIDVGCNTFIPKPVREDTLFDRLKTYLGLEWEYEQESHPNSLESPLGSGTSLEASNDANRDTDLARDIANAIPGPEVIQNLLQLAMMGDVVSIEEQAAQIEQQDDRFREFTTQLRQLAKGFQLKQIQALLKQYLPSPQSPTP